MPRAINLNVAVKEFGNKIVFLKKIIKGGADKSYGVYVAQMAGLPITIINRAKEILFEYVKEENDISPQVSFESKTQMGIFSEKEDALKDELKELDINELTPLEALKELDKLKKKHGI